MHGGDAKPWTGRFSPASRHARVQRKRTELCMRRIAAFCAWLWSLLPWADRPWKASKAEDLPKSLRPRIVYLIGESGHLWQAAMLCPCGCQAVIQLCLLPDASPRWDCVVHRSGSVSLHPSIFRQVGCRSHFFLRSGHIDWCHGN